MKLIQKKTNSSNDITSLKKFFLMILLLLITGPVIANIHLDEKISFKLKDIKKSNSLDNEKLLQEKFRVSGVVLDKDGTPLVGASVIEKGTNNGVATDFDGKFVLDVSSPNATLVVSYIGYLPKEVNVQNRKHITVVLEEDTTSLDEVIVVGYGKIKKKLSTGANLNMKGKDIENLAPFSAMQALQGISPGVNITQRSGQPGAGTKVYIRGIGTIGNSKPLYVVDGVVVNNIDYLSPSDIASVDVLKDAASSAIYGARAANGVILVTTKKGKKNKKLTVSFDTYFGIQNVARKPGVLNAQEYAYIMNEGRLNDGKPFYDYANLIPNWSDIENGWKGTNWFDEITHRNAPVVNHSININGGSENMIYSFGASKYEQDGIMGGGIIGAGVKRISLRLNTEFVIAKKGDFDFIKIGENLTYNNINNKKIADGNIYYNDVRRAIVTTPFMPIYNDAGNYTKVYENWDNSQVNPIGIMKYERDNVWNKRNGIVGNFYVEVQPIEDLVIKSTYGFDAGFGHARSYVPKFNLGTLFNRSEDRVSQGLNQRYKWIWTNTLNYKFQLKDHGFNFLVGSELTKQYLDMFLAAEANNSNFDDPDYAYISNVNIGELNQLVSLTGFDYGAQGTNNLVSFFTRLSYNYKEKYLITGVFRADGSPKFAPGKRWATFPSIALGWVVSNEDFLKESKHINSLKLRASWGQNGNEAIPPFGYSSSITNNGFYFFGNDNTSTTSIAYPTRIPNLNTSWETSEQLNFGFDARLFSKLAVTFDWYNKTTKDWLITPPILATAGAPSAPINGGEIQNKGVEVSLGWKERSNAFKWGVSANLAYNKNEVTEIANEEKIINGPNNVLSQGTSTIFRAEVGHPIGYFWAYETDGIIQNQQEALEYQSYFPDARPGDLRFVDQNNDGVIDELDKVEIGKPLPDFIYGFQFDASYKGWYGNATLTGQAGLQVMKSYRNFADKFKQNYTSEIFGRWHGEGTSDRIPRLTSTTHRNIQYMSDLYLYDADFLRISNLTIGYDFYKQIKSISYLSSLKIYLTGKNLFTFTKYNGLDPEVGYGPTEWSSGIDLGLYPSARTFILGLNLTF